MKYTVQPGLILRDVVGEHIMIATGEARRVCPPMKRFNDAGAFYWSLIEKGLEEEAMLEACEAHFRRDREEIRPSLRRFMTELAKNAYITLSETEE